MTFVIDYHNFVSSCRHVAVTLFDDNIACKPI